MEKQDVHESKYLISRQHTLRIGSSAPGHILLAVTAAKGDVWAQIIVPESN